MNALVTDLNVCSNKGLSERFDSTIGAATVLMPFGGKNQLTPAQAMVAKLPVGGETTTCSGMAWGFNPYLCLLYTSTAMVAIGVLSFVWQQHFHTYTQENICLLYTSRCV